MCMHVIERQKDIISSLHQLGMLFSSHTQASYNNQIKYVKRYKIFKKYSLLIYSLVNCIFMINSEVRGILK